MTDDHDADDLVQDVLLSVLENPPSELRRFRAWLRVAMVHAAARLFRRDRARRQREVRAATHERLQGTGESFEQRSFLGDLRSRVLRLSDPYREVVSLRYIDGLPIAEICDRLERPPGTVRCQLKRGLDRLRDDLDRRYGRRTSWAVLALGLRRPRPAAVGTGTGLTVAAGGVALSAFLVVYARSGAESVPHPQAESAVASVVAAGSLAASRDSLDPAGASARERTPEVAEAPGDLAMQPLTGRVVDLSWKGAAGSEILYAPRVGEPFELLTRSDDDGTFRIPSELVRAAVREHRGLLVARQAGYATPAPVALDLVPWAGELVLRLARPAVRLAGVVLSADGLPVASARVRVAPPTGPRPVVTALGVRLRVPPESVETDALGRFALDYTSMPLLHVTVEAPRHGPAVLVTEVPAEGEELELRLERSAAVAGAILNAHGAAAAGLELRLEPRGRLDTLHAHVVRTDAGGAYRIDDLAPGSYLLSASSPDGRESLRREFVLRAGEERFLDAQLGLGASVLGRLVDPSGRPLVGWRIELEDRLLAWERVKRCYSDDRDPIASVVTDSEGRFALGALAREKHFLRAHPPGAPSIRPVLVAQGVRPGPGERTYTVPELAQRATLSGEVGIDAAGDVPVLLTLRGLHMRDELRVLLASDGRFRLEELLPGTYSARLHAAGRPPFPLERIDLAAGDDLDLGRIALPPTGELVLGVRDPAGRVVCSDVRVGGKGIELDTSDDACGVRFDGEHISFAGLWPGVYEVVVNVPGAAAYEARYEVVPGDVTRAEIRLAVGSEVEMVVSAPRPLAWPSRVRLEIFDELDVLVARYHAAPSQDPARLLSLSRGLPAGDYRLVAHSDDGLSAVLEFSTHGVAGGLRVEVPLGGEQATTLTPSAPGSSRVPGGSY